MALNLYNTTTGELPVPENNPIVVLPLFTAAPALGERGPPVNVTEDFQNLSPQQYEAIQLLVDKKKIELDWSTGVEEFPTPGLTVGPASLAVQEISVDPGPDKIVGTEDDIYPVLARTAVFDEPDAETGAERAVEIFKSTPYRIRILQVFGTISRGAPGAELYLCCHPDGNHEPLSDRFDVSQMGPFAETARVKDVVIETDESVFAFLSNDYVLGRVTMTYQRIAE